MSDSIHKTVLILSHEVRCFPSFSLGPCCALIWVVSHRSGFESKLSRAHTQTHTNAQEWVFSTFQMWVYHGAVGSVGSAEDIQSHNTRQHRDNPSLSIFQQTTCCVCVSVCVFGKGAWQTSPSMLWKCLPGFYQTPLLELIDSARQGGQPKEILGLTSVHLLWRSLV